MIGIEYVGCNGFENLTTPLTLGGMVSKQTSWAKTRDLGVQR